MKDLLTAVSKKSYIGRTLRSVIIAFVIVYVMIMSALLPVSTLYFEARAKEEDTFVGVMLEEEKILIEETESIEDLLSSKEEEDIYVEEDRYTNTWNNEYNQEAEVVQEDESLRTANEKHFRMSDGSYTMVSHANAIHYLDNGEYKEIDNTLEKQGSSYKNKSNAIQVELPVTYSKNSKTQVTYGDFRLTFKLDKFVTSSDDDLTIENNENVYEVKSKNKHKFKINNESKAKYKFDNSQVELEQILVGTELKENIILHSTLPSYTFTFDIKTKGLYLTLQESGDIYAVSESTEEIVFVIPKGYMFDNSGSRSESVVYVLIEKSSGYELQVIAEASWINDKERVFPVTIDPSVTVNAVTDFKSAAEGTIANGLMPVNTSSMAFLDFTLPETITKATILYAELQLSIKADSNNTILYLWENTSDFTDNSAPADTSLDIPKDINDENSPKTTVYLNYYYDPNNEIPPCDMRLINGTSLQKYKFNITASVKNVVDFCTLDDYHGFAFSIPSGTGIQIANEDYADTNHTPILEIKYRNMVGLESYWDYEEYGVGNSTVYLNNYNDEATIVHTDVLINSQMPIEVQHIHMDRYEDVNYDIDGIFTGVNYGFGWKLNYQQIIRSRGSNFEYYDADGTMHYFYYDSEKGYSQDEDGLGLKLYGYTNNAFRMEDMADNSMYFDYHGRLFKIVDKNGNTTNILYGNGSQATTSKLPITEINDNNGNAVTLTYNSSGYLTKINYKRADGITSGSTTISYSDSKVSKIVNDDDTYTVYGYSGNRIVTLSNESGYKLELISDETGVFSAGLERVYGWLEPPTAKVRSIWHSANGQEKVHLKDNVYCHGLTLSVTTKEGEDYVPYSSIQIFTDMNNEDMEPHFAGMSDFEKVLYTMTIGWAYLIYYGYNNIEPYMDTCKEYYSSNFRIKKCYDICGRLISSYVDEFSSMSIDTKYDISSVNVKKNKPIANSTYVANITNYVGNSSFEEGVESWTITNSTNPYKTATTSTRFATHGNSSLEMFVAQPSTFFVKQGFLVIKGKYTVTGYIKVDNLLVSNVSNNEYGAYLYVTDNQNNMVGKSEYVNKDIYTNNNGFKKVTFTFEAPTLKQYYIYLAVANCAGFVYFDQIQVSYNNYGLIESYNNAINTSYLQGDDTNTGLAGWNVWTDIPDDITLFELGLVDEAINGISYAKLHCNGNGSVNFYQRVPLEKNTQSMAYNVSTWLACPDKYYLADESAFFGLNYRLFDENMNPLTGFCLEKMDLSFALWYKISRTFIAPPNARYVEINIQLNKIIGTIYVDNVSLVQAQVVNLGYDEFGNNSYYSDGNNKYYYDEQASGATISVNGVEKYGVMKDDNGNVILSADYARQVKTEYSYDSFGRVVSETFATIDNSKKISSSTTYSSISDNLFEVVSSTDSLGFKTISNAYAYSGLLSRTTFNDGTYVEYDYGAAVGSFSALPSTIVISNKDASGNVITSVTYNYFSMEDSLTSSDYGYRHVGSLRSVQMPNGTVYSYEYDAWGNVIKVKLNGVAQITYCYNANGTLISKTLANGYTENYYYDSLYRLIKVVAKDSSNVVVRHYEFEYTVEGTLVASYDVLEGICYLQEYDASGRNITNVKGSYEVVSNSSVEYKVHSVEQVYETIYSVYGEVEKVNEISAKEPTFSFASVNKSLSGTLTRSRVGLTETISIGGTPKIIYTYNSTNVQYGKVVCEDNTMLSNSTYPNGIRLRYARDTKGRIISITISPYGTDSNAITYDAQYDANTNAYEFDGGYESLWNVEWMQQNAPSLASYPVSQLDDEEYNGITISNIIKLHHGTFYVSGSSHYSLVDPAILKLGVLGSEITFWAKVVRLTSSGDTNILVPRIRYSDGTVGNAWDKVENVAKNKLINDGSWQFFSIPINKNKQIVAIELPWSNGAWLAIGNMTLYGKRDVWDTDWAIANVATASLPVTKVATQKESNTNVVTDIIRVHSGSFYAGNFGGTEVYQSLVNPDILANGEDRIVLSYQARIDVLNESYSAMSNKDSLVRGLRFRYSDGVADYAGHASIKYTTDWQKITIVSAPGKQVIGIELGYNYGDWILLGDISVTLQNVGRLDNRLVGQTLSNDAYLSYEYDELGRQAEVDLYSSKGNANALLSEAYSYLDGTDGNTSYNVTAKAISYGSSDGITYNYTYNLDNPALGDEQLERSNPYNIWQIKEDNTVKVEYSYDLLGRLVRENNAYANATITYTYDDNNNLTSKTTYAYTTGTSLTNGITQAYTYGDTTFKDRLTSYNGNNITYDALGNPLSYMGNTLTWEGRELQSYGSLSFKYDMNGLRSSKGSIDYLYSGTTLVEESNSTHTIYYLYGQSGLIGFELDGIPYYYVRNLLGDVTGVIDTSGNLVVQYAYDSWGKVLSTTGSMADTVGTLNPIRYRGYYYDVETGLYYLQSRYYDPETGRFISPDEFDYLGVDGTPLSFNLYTYCNNNPVKYSDEAGNFAISGYLTGLGLSTFIGACVGAVSYTAGQAFDYLVTGDFEWSWGGFTGSTVAGAIMGAINYVAPGMSVAGSAALGGAISNLSGMLFENIIDGTEYSTLDIVVTTALSAGFSAASATTMSKYKIFGFNWGENSYEDVSNRMFESFRKGIVPKISVTTISKKFSCELYNNSIDIIIGGLV